MPIENLETTQTPAEPEALNDQKYTIPLNEKDTLTASAKEIVELQKKADRQLEATIKEHRESYAEDERKNDKTVLFYKTDPTSRRTKKISERWTQEAKFQRQLKESVFAVSGDMIPEAKSAMEATGRTYEGPKEGEYEFKGHNGRIESLTVDEIQKRLAAAQEEADFQQQRYEEAMAHSRPNDEEDLEVIRFQREAARKDARTLKETLDRIPETT